MVHLCVCTRLPSFSSTKYRLWTTGWEFRSFREHARRLERAEVMRDVALTPDKQKGLSYRSGSDD